MEPRRAGLRPWRSDVRWALLLAAALVLLGLCYGESYGAPLFPVDDDELLLAPQFSAPLSWQTLSTVLTPGNSPDYYPVRDLSYLVDIKLFGDRWFFFRLHQAAIFALLALLLFFVMRAVEVPAAPAWATVLLWALHPVHAEMICWLGSRREVLSLTLGVAAVLSVVWAIKRDSTVLHVIGLLMFGLALLSKASVTPLPALGLAAAGLGLPGWRRRKALLALGAAAGLAGVALLFTAWYYRSVNDMTFPYPGSYRLAASAAALGKMVSGWAYPAMNVVDGENWGEWLSMQRRWVPVGVALWIALGAGLALAIRRRWRVLGLSLGGFLLLYLPVSGLGFPHRNFYSVRYLEPGLLALVVGAGVAVGRWYAVARAPTRRWMAIAAAVAGVVLLAATRVEARVWSQPLSVIDKALRQQPQSVALQALRLAELQRIRARGQATPEQAAEIARARAELRERCTTSDLDRLSACIGFWSMQLAEEAPDPSPERSLILARATAWLDARPGTTFWADSLRFQAALGDGTLQRELVLRWLAHRRWPIKKEIRLLAWAASCFERDPGAAEELRRLFRRGLLAPPDAGAMVGSAHSRYRPTLMQCLPALN